jgi:hypothetical protein
MPDSVPSIETARKLVQAARMSAAAFVPTETHQSYPIPQPAAGALRSVVFLYCTSRLQPRLGMFLMAPDRQAQINAATGELLTMRAVTPAELGVSDDPGKVLGRFGLPKEMTSEQYLAEQERLYAAYDGLLPVWFAGSRLASAGDAARSAGREFRLLFPKISEPPLAPYYRAAGIAFWKWLEEGA